MYFKVNNVLISSKVDLAPFGNKFFIYWSHYKEPEIEVNEN